VAVVTVNAPIRNGQLVDHVGSAIHHGTESLEVIPKLLRQLLEAEAWREFRTKLGDDVRHERFAEFVATPPLKGLGTTIEFVRQLIAKDPVALDLLDQATQNRHGGDHSNVDNVPVARPTGNSAEKALRRLRKDRPDLHAQVLAGSLSPHGAMVEAGFRRRTITVSVTSPEGIASTLRRHLDHEALLKLAALLFIDDQGPGG
jgi:hypothetical protein